MKRISKQAKAIADAHLQAQLIGKFDDPHVTSSKEVIAQLKAGKTFSELIRLIEIRDISIFSIVASTLMKHQSIAYKKAVYNQFKKLIDK